ncbi:MAG: fumarate hydratase [Bacteroidota bacterium]
MRDLTNEILELIRQTSTSLPGDVETRLREAVQKEQPGSAARGALETILKNVELSRANSTPICQDTGTPIFYIRHPEGWSTRSLKEQVRAALAEATRKSFMRPNAVDAVTDRNSGNNLGGEEFPSIHFEEVAAGQPLTIELMLKGGGCENVGRQYSLPDNSLGAGRDLAGVRKVVLDAVHRAQGQGCAPGILGVAIGGDRGTSFARSKEVLLAPIGARNADPKLAALEERLTGEANRMGIGPMGFGGQTTVIDTKIAGLHRLPASYYVSVSYMCWAYRRRRMTVTADEVIYD